jgi:pyrroline-5-carboxylate reductase
MNSGHLTSRQETGLRMTLLGCGRMGFALLKGWLASGIPAENFQVVEPNPSANLVHLANDSGLRTISLDEADEADVVILAVKPQSVAEASAQASTLLGADSLLLSVVAGVSLQNLRTQFPKAASVIRAMPNLAAIVGQGASALVAETGSPGTHRRIAENLLKAVGITEWVAREELVDVITALSGSGPAYAFYLAECLAAAGVKGGLPESVAGRLARATIQGAGAILASSGDDPATLREQVTSPGGTTHAGLAILMKNGGLESLIHETVAAAAQRSRELGQG